MQIFICDIYIFISQFLLCIMRIYPYLENSQLLGNDPHQTMQKEKDKMIETFTLECIFREYCGVKIIILKENNHLVSRGNNSSLIACST